ncbi:MAG: hypothetical protein JO314_04845 [Acidobacteria bacterium]|nr:hypothetical protein [Acidobacteriota bacterium]
MTKIISPRVHVCALALIIALAVFQTFSAGGSVVKANPKGCSVTAPDGATATIVASGKSVELTRGTALTLVDGHMHQGYIAVSAKVAGRFQRLSIFADDTNCMDR